jgi:hypothetical protein
MGKKIHPIIAYPYRHPRDTTHLRTLYTKLIKDLAQDKDIYSRPITVLSADSTRQMRESTRSTEFERFLDEFVRLHSEILEVWSVDTCQRWLSGFGKAFEEPANSEHVYWLIPGDFQYAGRDNILDTLRGIPARVNQNGCRLCLGEIAVPINSPKQLIDTYGTYALLFNWFPTEGKSIVTVTSKPRTEFFAINYDSLAQALHNPWYAYEQTIVLILEIIGNQFVINSNSVQSIALGSIEDPPEGRETVANAMQQIERMDRMFKDYWRQVMRRRGTDWTEEFKQLDMQSEEIRRVALGILRRTLNLP